ncbi:PRC-barrel domain-containing protein [Luteolibacter arcticus]|uniref:PRC-barrel domain-containing protein n=1 Tax=Luteolibacter arcticus TaxID=1581411 RepID=A0ABT3GQU5_9BACT|nr:PRC-barrel domain-containing protein [Luteolibacter arcticus]MCW1925833.1 PRC-barrel domain-containing protein [Luteolibacter arcticus]
MKVFNRTAICSLLPFFIAIPAMAQKPDSPEEVTQAIGKNSESAWRASKLIGMDLVNSSKESIGEIKDIAIDLESGKVLGVIVSTGGFLGVQDTLSAVPISALAYDADSKSFTTSLTKEQVGKVPQFKSTEWPDLSSASLGTKLRGVRDSIGGDVSAPDNTAKNERDMNEKTTTPVDQGNSDSDLKMTKDIRSTIVGADLSFNAKNIKIITRDGAITLRGVVESKEEHAAILKIAKEHAGSATISDNLEVKTK